MHITPKTPPFLKFSNTPAATLSVSVTSKAWKPLFLNSGDDNFFNCAASDIISYLLFLGCSGLQYWNNCNAVVQKYLENIYQQQKAQKRKLFYLLVLALSEPAGLWTFPASLYALGSDMLTFADLENWLAYCSSTSCCHCIIHTYTIAII